MTVSAIIYSRNEADLLRVCLAAVTGFDDVVVCDMQSSDDTVMIAREGGARVVTVPDARVVEEVRQHGLDSATTDWVLFVDADEILPRGFAGDVRKMIASAAQSGTVAFRLRYSNVAFGRTLLHTLVGSAKYSLMRTSHSHYPSEGRAHVPPIFNGPVGDAPSEVPPILHLNIRGVEQMVEKSLRYAPDTQFDANILKPTGFLREMLRSVVFARSWQDGYAGTALSTSAVIGRWYAALLVAERNGVLPTDLPAGETRRLNAVQRTHRAIVRVRDRFKRLRRVHEKVG